MNLLKKTNKYLIEHYPLLWHSKAMQMMLTGISFWILSLFWGYCSTDIYSLQRTLFTNLYERSNFVFYHVIFCLITFCIWGISFYKNNAYKNNYPLKKGYFISLFFLLFIPFFFILSAYLPFTLGCKLKTQNFIKDHNISEETDKLNLGYAFLCSGNNYDKDGDAKSDYYISNRQYPDPYPLASMHFDRNENIWSDTLLKIREGNNFTDYSPSQHEKENNVELDGMKYQFYTTEYRYPNNDSCLAPFQLITKFYHGEELDDPHIYSVLNFSSILIYNDYYLMMTGEYNGQPYKTKYAPQIYELIKKNNTDGIRKVISDFILICDQYAVKNNLDADVLLRYLMEKSFHGLDHTIVFSNDYYLNDNGFDLHPAVQFPGIKNNKELVDFLETQKAFYFYENELRELFTNFQQVQHSFVTTDMVMVVLFMTLFFVCVFICFEFTTMKSFLISLPVAGVIAVIVGLITTFIHDNGYVCLLSFLIIILLTMIGLYLKKIRKGILAVLINLTYFIAPFFFIVWVVVYNELTKQDPYWNKCMNSYEMITHNSMFLTPAFLFLFSLTGVLLFLPVLRKWKACKE